MIANKGKFLQEEFSAWWNIGFPFSPNLVYPMIMISSSLRSMALRSPVCKEKFLCSLLSTLNGLSKIPVWCLHGSVELGQILAHAQVVSTLSFFAIYHSSGVQAPNQTKILGVHLPYFPYW